MRREQPENPVNSERKGGTTALNFIIIVFHSSLLVPALCFERQCILVVDSSSINECNGHGPCWQGNVPFLID